MTASDPGGELARLRAENAALDEQVKLLVQTEQRFYRSQSQLDAQLARLERLASFALETTRVQTAGEILRRAVAVLSETFDLDWAGALRIDDQPPGVTVLVESDPREGGHPQLELTAENLEWLRSLAQPHFAGVHADPRAAALVAALSPSVAEAARAGGGLVALIPIRRVQQGRHGLLVTFSVGGRPMLARPEGGSEQQRPFLQLLANHLEHAIANTELTEHLRENGERLARSLESLERTQQQLLQAQKMDAIGRLAGGVAHDFNNLLTVILGYAGALSASMPSGAPQQENVMRVLEAARRAADITSQLLALGRRQMRRLENVDLSAQAARTAELLARLVGEDIRVELALDPTLPPVRADRSQLEQVLLNLVVNARDAMPEGGRLYVRTRRATEADAIRCGEGVAAARYAALEIQDEGVGMDQGTLAQAFEPFFTTKPGGQGSGLGLAVVYGIVTQSDGHVFGDSEPGRGTRFCVLLPFGNAQPVALEPPRRTAAAAPVPAASILVVEDEPALREVVRESLRRAGHRVQVAADGEEALALLPAGTIPPDLVLTDVRMPRLGGLPMAEQLARRHPGVRIAFMSGYSEDLLAHLPQGTRAFLAKPFTPQDLLAFVGAQLAARA